MDLKDEFGENLYFKIKHRFGFISLNRTERSNALTLEMIENLKKALVYCQNSPKIRGVVLTGKGSTFTTGMDLDSIDGSDNETVNRYEKNATEIAKLLFNGKPSICAINGRAMGDGVAYALSCDYRIAVKSSFFWMPEVKIGVFPGAATIVLMTRMLGIPWTKRILMFAEKIDTDTAQKIGLIDQIVDSQEDLLNGAIQKAKFLFTKNQKILNLIKLCANHLGDKSFSRAYELEKKALMGWVKDQKGDFLREFKNQIKS
ncbi:MAG: putative 3-hydroxypropionyl-coenzyme A dehydratase [Promethearchaeota archaeon]|nr:MAG: putative 3-hydroxypropionyl-coenzyme A dehydratase [Candidatus Lokiarchaeota archaeon]